jgi:chromosome segregation ATPase
VIRDELRAFGGRVDVLSGKVETLTAIVDELAQRVHRTNNVVMRLTDETSALREAQKTLDRALDFVETQQRARLQELERANKAIERAVEFIEARVRRVNDELADFGTGGEGE